MSDLVVELTALNGRVISLPTGLFINNEFIKSETNDLISSIDPTSVQDESRWKLVVKRYDVLITVTERRV